jgi:hypothetical protein
MGTGRAGAIVEIAGDTVFVVMFFAVRVGVGAIVHMGVTVLAAVAVMMAMGMGAERRLVMTVSVFMPVVVRMGMHRAVLMDMSVLVLALDLRFPCAAAANCTHIRLLITRFQFP